MSQEWTEWAVRYPDGYLDTFPDDRDEAEERRRETDEYAREEKYAHWRGGRVVCRRVVAHEWVEVKP